MLPLADLPPGWTVGKSGDQLPRDLQRRQPLREDRRPRRELHPVRRQGHGLHLLPPHRRRVERDPALHLRDGRRPQGAGQVRLGEARRGQGHRRSARRATPPRAAPSSTRASTTPRSSRPRTTPSSPPSPWSWPSGSPPAEAGKRRHAAARAPRSPGDRPPGRRPRPSPSARSHPDLLRPPAGRRASRATPSTSPRTSSATASCPTSSWPITRRASHLAGLPPPLPRRRRRPRRCFEKYVDRRQAGRGRDQDDRGRGGRRDDRQLEHRPVRRRLPQGEHVAGANGATDAQAGRGLRPGLRQEPAGARVPSDRAVDSAQ